MNNSWLLQIKIDKSVPKAVYVQIADGIIKSIRSGQLKAGVNLPGTRLLAAELGVNRNTVIQALDILVFEGWLISEERKRVYVSDKLSISAPVKTKESQQETTEIFKRNLIFFDDGLPDTACTPMTELARAYRRIFNQKAHWQIMNLASEFGDDKFRDTLSNMLNQNRGMRTSLSEICITRGSQMALFLTAHCLLKKGDIVLIENPGFKPAWETFRHAGAILIPITVDNEGIDIGKIEDFVSKRAVKAIYLTPHHQYPTTVTLSLARRLKLIELSNRYHFTIIEDDYDNEFHFGQRPVMPISAYEGIRHYVYIGTFSKLIAPAIRIGYVVSSPEFIVRIGKLRKIIDMQGDTIMEQSILDLILSGDIRRHQKRMLSHYERKRDFFDGILQHYLKDKVVYKKPDGGLAFWLTPVEEVDLFRLKQNVNSKLVSFYTPDRFSYDDGVIGIRLGYASLSEAHLEKGIKALSECLERKE